MLQKLTNTPLVRVLSRETSRIADSWVLIFYTIIAPVATFILIIWLFSGGVVKDLPVAVVDMDQSAFSFKAARLIDATRVCKIKCRLNSILEAKKMMDAGKIDAFVVFPENLEKKILRSDSPSIAVYINDMYVGRAGALRSGLFTTLSTISAGVKVQVAVKKGQTPDQAIEKARPVKANIQLLFNPYGNYAYFLVLGLLPLLSVVFIFLGSVYALGMEFKEGTASDLMSKAKNNIFVALSGKMIPYTFLFFLNMLVMDLLMIKTLGTPLRGSLALILVSEILLIISYQLLAILFIKLTANLRLSLSLGSAYTMMALTFSGLTFPLMSMPIIARLFSYIFPFTSWLHIFMSQTLRGEPAIETFYSFLAFIPFILAGFLAFPGAKRKLSDPVYWYRD
jgi:ABC-2 type transport system permease protein